MSRAHRTRQRGREPKRRWSADSNTHNRRLVAYLEAIGETEPHRLPALPSCFSPTDKSGFLDVSHSQLRVTYRGPAVVDSDSAQIRANTTIPTECGIYYFEVQLLGRGREGFIGIGLSTKDVRLDKLPGWDKGSYGYHGDDGKKFRESGHGEAYGPTYSTGDTVGCLVNFLASSVHFTKNGLLLGCAFANIRDRELYPAIGMRSDGESIGANFGQEPFVFDLASYVKGEAARLRGSIRAHQCKADVDTASARLLLLHLIYEGYAETAAAFARSSGLEEEAEPFLENANKRRAVTAAIRSGDIAAAVGLINEYDPRLLSTRQDLAFMLSCQRFLELLKAESFTEAIAYGEALATEDDDQPRAFPSASSSVTPPAAGGSSGGGGGGVGFLSSEDVDDMDPDPLPSPESRSPSSPPLPAPRLAPVMASLAEQYRLNPEDVGSRTPKHRSPACMPPERRRAILQKVFGLIGYTDPAAAPNGFLLDDKMRSVLAQRVNDALIAFSDSDDVTSPPHYSGLERLLQQTRVTIDRLEGGRLIGLFLQSSLPLGYASQERVVEGSQEWKIAHFFSC